VGLVYSILQVRFFGASAMVDAFFIAMSAVYMITSLIQGGQLAEVFLPEYLKQKKNFGPTEAHKLLSAILNRLLLFVGIGLLILFFLAPLIIKIIGPGLLPEYKELSIKLFILSLSLILFTLIASFINTTLNAEQIFGRAEVTGLINRIISIVLLVAFYKKLGVFILVFSLLAGKIVEFGIGLYFLRKIDYRYRLIWNVKNYKVSHFFKVMFTTSGYVGATQLYSVTLTAMASFLPVGSLSIFNYVQQLVSKASGIIMGPFSTVFFSKFSNIVALRKQNLVAHLKKPLSIIFVLTFIIFCFITLEGKEVLHFLWSKKSLSEHDFAIAFWMLSLNFFGIIFSSTGTLLRKAAVALGGAQRIYKNWIITQLFSALYSFISIYFFGILGLITVPLINMVLMALVSFLVAQKSGIKTSHLIIDLISTKRFILFFSISLISTVVLIFGFNMLALSAINNIIIKSIFLLIIIFFLLMKLYRGEMNDLLFSFRKK
jgi:putative peptidoglycan lipid II flippase